VPYPWPFRGAENRRLALLAIGWLLALHLWATASMHVAPLARPSPWGPDAGARAPAFARLDSGWYGDIAGNGYGPPPPPGSESAHAFFPLYPMVGRAVFLTTGLAPLRALSLVSWLCFLLALPLFADEVRVRLGPGRTAGPLAFLLLYPVAFFFAAAYTESLYLFLVLLAFRLTRDGRTPSALAVAFLLGLTRAPAAAVGPALALACAARPGAARRWVPAAALAVMPLAGVLAYVFGIGWMKGEPGLFLRAMGAWAHRSTNPILGVVSFVREPFELLTSSHFLRHPGALAPFAHFLLFAVLLVVQARRKRWSDAAWTAGVLGLSVLTGTTAGIPRYTSTVFPGLILLAELFEDRPRARFAALALSAALLLLNVAFFVNWHFVS
jgi:hypothetical protein